jgi:hypothetical protein
MPPCFQRNRLLLNHKPDSSRNTHYRHGPPEGFQQRESFEMKSFLSVVITGFVIFVLAYSVFAASPKHHRGFETLNQRSSPWATIIGEND